MVCFAHHGISTKPIKKAFGFACEQASVRGQWAALVPWTESTIGKNQLIQEQEARIKQLEEQSAQKDDQFRHFS
jgi:hypothetical protein